MCGHRLFLFTLFTCSLSFSGFTVDQPVLNTQINFFDKELSEEGLWEEEEFSEEEELSEEDGFSYDIEGLELIQKERMPKHISFIMDGNRRWAKKHNLSKIEGHAKGADTLIKLLKFIHAADLGIETISVYAFSTENWKRDGGEVTSLMDLFTAYINEIFPYLERYSIRMETIGDLEGLPVKLQEAIQRTKDFSLENPKLTLVLALNYGGRNELKRAFSKMIVDFEKGSFVQTDLSEELIESYLDTHSMTDPELVIRTSGESRISNFLLWQLAYSELYFSPLLWPDFSQQELIDILLEFQGRERRFGGEIR